MHQFFQFFVRLWFAAYLAAPAFALAEPPTVSVATSSPAAMQECYLAVEKINKIRPNWLATSYGECRSANQCSTQKCQDEILRKQEYVSHSEKETTDQSSARSMAVLMREIGRAHV